MGGGIPGGGWVEPRRSSSVRVVAQRCTRVFLSAVPRVGSPARLVHRRGPRAFADQLASRNGFWAARVSRETRAGRVEARGARAHDRGGSPPGGGKPSLGYALIRSHVGCCERARAVGWETERSLGDAVPSGRKVPGDRGAVNQARRFLIRRRGGACTGGPIGVPKLGSG